jgi:predicted phage terminase large subunit-like protein
VIFRRKSTEITGGGGLWEESMKLFPIWGANMRQAPMLDWRFKNRSMIEFRHLQHAGDEIDHHGKQYAEVAFDELTTFLEQQFWYLISRLRSTCGFRPCVVATCNPDSDSWVRKLIDWWIGPDGLARADRAGKKRYFIRDGNTLIWGNTPAECRAQAPHIDMKPMSLRFIPARLKDNPRGDPSYEERLKSLPLVERERLLGGNWNVRAVAGSYFQRGYFEIVDRVPGTIVKRARGWDLAATEPNTTNPDPDWTCGVGLAQLDDGRLIVDHVERCRKSPAGVDATLKAIASQDGLRTIQAFWQDPAQAGKAQREYIVNLLRGYRVRFTVASEDKETYAGPVSSDAENRKILLLRAPWNEPFLSVLEGFPTAKKKDDVDALSRAHRELTKPSEVVSAFGNNERIPGL